MTQEEKDLLLKDLCARLPYGVIGQCEIDASYDTSFDTIFQTHKFDAAVYGLKEDFLLVTPLIEDNDEQEFANEEVADGVYILDFKPYLFPLSSMNEEQKKEYNYWKHEVPVGYYEYGDIVEKIELFDSPESFQYLIENHFDYHGLIERGFAIDATGKNIY
jgi:hypothetical protein